MELTHRKLASYNNLLLKDSGAVQISIKLTILKTPVYHDQR